MPTSPAPDTTPAPDLPPVDDVLAAVGPRLKQLRAAGDLTLAELSAATGISTSTLSRLESGQRGASLELLLPIARAHGVALDALVAGPSVPDPRVQEAPLRRHGALYQPLTRRPGGLQAYKITLPAGSRERPTPQRHEGYEWLFVLAGRARLVMAHHDVVLATGEAAEFDTQLPHWFGNADDDAVELLSLFGPQGERVHLRTGQR